MDGLTPSTDHSGQRSASKRGSELAGRQFGAIARHQLITVGFSEARIRSWLRTERLHRRYPGVYAWGREELSTEGQLATSLLYAGPGAALGGLTALWWLELLNRRPDRTFIDSPGRARSLPAVQIRHPADVERTWHRDIPVVPLPEALLSAARFLRRDSLRLVLARAEFQHLLSLSSLQAAMGRGRAGSGAVRAAMDAHLPQLARCTNRFERSFVLLCERHGLPIPDPNERIGRYRPDMLWPQQRLIVELDGHDAQSTAAQLAADARRQAELEARGFTVVRFTWRDVTERPAEVAAAVAMHLS